MAVTGAKPIRPPKPTSPKHGDTREDGFRFQGFIWVKGTWRGNWISPECLARKKTSCNQSKRERYASDPSYAVHLKERNKRRRVSGDMGKYTRKSKYGLDHKDYIQLLSHQGNRCCGCRAEFSGTPHIDHCHHTGVVRGLLCINCNYALGQAKDSAVVLQNLIEYLRQPPTQVLGIHAATQRSISA